MKEFGEFCSLLREMMYGALVTPNQKLKPPPAGHLWHRQQRLRRGFVSFRLEFVTCLLLQFSLPPRPMTLSLVG